MPEMVSKTDNQDIAYPNQMAGFGYLPVNGDPAAAASVISDGSSFYKAGYF